MGLPDATISIADGGGAGGAAGGGAAPGFAATPAVPTMVLSGPVGLTALSADALGVPNYSVNGSPPAPIGSSLLVPYATPRVTKAGVMTVGGVSIAAQLVDWKRGDTVTRASAANWPQLTAWPDKSGLGHDEAAVGAPTWLPGGPNNRPGVVISSGNYFSSAASNLIASGGQRTVFMVVRSTNSTGGRLLTFRVSGTQFILQLLNSGGFLYYADGVSTNARIIDTPVISGVPLIIEFSYDASVAGADAAVRIRINGVDHGVTAATPVAETGGQGWATGSDVANQSLNFPGPIFEKMVFAGTLDPIEKGALYGYFGPYYGVAYSSPTQFMPVGDSTTRGLGGGVATGGWRQAVSAQHPNLQFIGGVYAPASLLGDTDNGGAWKRCEGHSGFTSGPIVPPGAGQGIGGPQLASYLGANGTIPDLIWMQIGQNDAGLGTYTAAQTAQNFSDNLDSIFAIAPSCKVICARSNRRRSNNTASNAVIAAQAAAISAAIAGKPNVLGTLEIPPDQGDEVYVDDDHFTAGGYAVNAAWVHRALVARNY